MKFGKRNDQLTTVWINARFIDRPTTGVERVARELIGAIAKEHLNNDGEWRTETGSYRFRLIAPCGGNAESPWPNLPLVRRGRLQGHAWEQFELPRITAFDWLVSLCNTGPVLKRRQIVYLHDAQPFAIPGNFSAKFRIWYRALFALIAKSSREILANSQFTRRELAHYLRLKPEAISLCYPGSEHARNSDVDPEALKRFNLPGAPFVLAVSSCSPNKNFQRVLQALAILGDDAPPCVIVGRQDQSHFAADALELNDVTHLGYVSDDELYALYRRALCLVFPSYYEGFGLPPLEAMAVGCPVIVSETTAMREVAGLEGNFCDPDSASSIAAAIARLSSDREYRNRSITTGIARAKGFSWATSAETFLRRLSGATEYQRE